MASRSECDRSRPSSLPARPASISQAAD